MSIVFTCGRCRKPYLVDESMAGEPGPLHRQCGGVSIVVAPRGRARPA